MMTINERIARRLRVAVVSLASAALAATAGIVLAPPATAASLVEVTSFGDNPGRMRMHVYVPDNRPANPAIVVAMRERTPARDDRAG